MSELRQLEKALTGLQGRGPSQGAIDEALALHERLGKLLLKASQLDPVTSLPRYGPETVAKMQRLTDEAAGLLRDLEEFAKQEEAKARDTVFLQPIAIIPVQKEEPPPRLGEDEEAQRRQQVEEIEEELRRQKKMEEKLARDAEESRKKRVADRQELQRIVDGLNSVGSSIDGFSGAFGQLPLKGPPRAFLSNLLARIVANPNDDKLRRLRLDHPAVVENLASSGKVSLDCLTHMGFMPIIEAAPDQTTSTIDHRSVGTDLYDALLRLSINSRSHVVLILEEPPITDSARWIAWFDYLSALREIAVSSQPLF